MEGVQELESPFEVELALLGGKVADISHKVLYDDKDDAQIIYEVKLVWDAQFLCMLSYRYRNKLYRELFDKIRSLSPKDVINVLVFVF